MFVIFVNTGRHVRDVRKETDVKEMDVRTRSLFFYILFLSLSLSL